MTDNRFRAFFDAGYRRIVPIVPPGAPLSPKSSLALRMAKNAANDARGKAPGVRGDDGLWRGFDWLKHDTAEADLERWHTAGAGVGIRTGGGLVAVDIDTLNADLSAAIEDAARTHLGPAPLRWGRRPKRLLLYRTAEEHPYRRVIFDDGVPCKPGAEARVELLTEGRQFVAHGIHPVSGTPYEWQPYLPPATSLPPITAQQLAAFFADLSSWLPAAATHTESSSLERATVDQAQLAGDPETVAAAVAALPNTTELFPGYSDYVRVGYAIKGAMQDDPDAGLELFQGWAARWDGDNDPDRVAADWHRMKPPFSVGAQYLYELAKRHGGFEPADAWFSGDASPAASASPWDTSPAGSTEPTIEPIRWANLVTWSRTEPPKQEWEVDGFIPRGIVTLLYGEGGVGKTLAMHQYAVAAAAGVDWLGQPTRPARVMCVFCEDEEAELHRRHAAILRTLNVDGAAVAERLRIVSRNGEDNVLAAFSRSNGTLQRTAFWHQIRDEAVAWQADVTIVDTIADTFGGSEIDRIQVNAFVKSALGGLARATGGSTIALGHPSVAGRAEGRSGSTAWSNAARSRIYLRRPKGQEKGNLRELEGMKSNRGPVGNLLRIKWQAGAFALVGESKPIDLNAFKESTGAVAAEGGSAASTAGRPVAGVATGRPLSIEAQEERAVLAALAAAHTEGRALNMSTRSSAYAPKVLQREYPEIMEAARGVDAVDACITGLLRTGRVRAAVWRDPQRRHRVEGYEVVTAEAASTSESVFN